MKNNGADKSVGLSASATEGTAAVGKLNEGNGPEGSLSQQTYFVEDHGRYDHVMRSR